jgi:hypothetical protein
MQLIRQRTAAPIRPSREAITRIAGRVQNAMRYSDDGVVDPIETIFALRVEFPFVDQHEVDGCAWRAYLMGEHSSGPSSAARRLLLSGVNLGPRDLTNTLGVNGP